MPSNLQRTRWYTRIEVHRASKHERLVAPERNRVGDWTLLAAGLRCNLGLQCDCAHSNPRARAPSPVPHGAAPCRQRAARGARRVRVAHARAAPLRELCARHLTSSSATLLSPPRRPAAADSPCVGTGTFDEWLWSLTSAAEDTDDIDAWTVPRIVDALRETGWQRDPEKGRALKADLVRQLRLAKQPHALLPRLAAHPAQIPGMLMTGPNSPAASMQLLEKCAPPPARASPTPGRRVAPARPAGCSGSSCCATSCRARRCSRRGSAGTGGAWSTRTRSSSSAPSRRTASSTVRRGPLRLRRRPAARSRRVLVRLALRREPQHVANRVGLPEQQGLPRARPAADRELGVRRAAVRPAGVARHGPRADGVRALAAPHRRAGQLAAVLRARGGGGAGQLRRGAAAEPRASCAGGGERRGQLECAGHRDRRRRRRGVRAHQQPQPDAALLAGTPARAPLLAPPGS